MATQQQINDIAGLYVAYFDRAPDPAGLQFWIDQLDGGRDFATISQDFAESEEAKEIYPFLATPDLVNNSPAAFVTSIYANLFGRAPDQAGLNFWVDVLGNGEVAPGDMVEAIMLGAQDTLVNGELIQDKTTVENKIECALEFTNAVVAIEGFDFDAEAYSAARQSIDGVNATQASVDAAKLVTIQYINEFAEQTTFTLTQPQVAVSGDSISQDVMKTVLYWGYNPHSHDENGVDNTGGANTGTATNEGPEDGGIPADAFFAPGGYLSIIASQAFAGVDQIDVDEDMFSIIDFSSVQTITISGSSDEGNVTQGNGQGNGGIITFGYTDGSSDDIALGEAYYDFLCKLILDDEGNSRFFEREVAAEVPVYVDSNGNVTTVASDGVGEPIGYIPAVLITEGETSMVDVPLVLTTTANNGSTTFPGFTSADNDTIVAGTLDLLHGATLDGGLGVNTLEVDAKGHFAQPKELSNIQYINIHNLPNIYTLNDQDNSSDYPDVVENSGGEADSILDLSRAVDLVNVTITEGDYDYLDAYNADPGAIVVTGLRNDATLTLQGHFDEDVYVRTGAGFSGDGFTVNLENVNAEGYLYIADNSAKLNLVSNGGGNNIYEVGYYDDNRVTDLVISGDAHLFIEQGLDEFMEDYSPVTIDASANTGGVDLNMDDYNQGITFIGSEGNDRVSFDAYDESGTSEGPDYGDDAFLIVVNTKGDNYYDSYSPGTLTHTDGDGNNILKYDVGGAVVSLGNGNNTVAMEVTELDLTVGDGDNFIDIDTSGYTDTYINKERFDENIKIVAGDGANEICVDIDDQFSDDVAIVDITAGDGGNIIKVESSNGDEQVDVTVNTGTGADAITAMGSSITINSGGGNDTITLVGIDSDFVTDEVDLEGTTVITPGGQDVTENEFTDGALLNIDTGTGSATINLGAEGETGNLASQNVIAKPGSVITGEDITLNVNTYANLIAADISGVTSVILDDDAGNRSDSAQANDGYLGDRAQLTLTMDQYMAMGADSFSVDGAIFNTHAFLKIIITESTSLTDLGVDTLPSNIDLYLEINDGATLTMTAEQLHTRVARDGVTLAEDGNTDVASGNVVITGGGTDFDPFNTNDTIQSVIGGSVYYGGSLSTADFPGGLNVDVSSVFGGYDRPADAPSEVVLTVDQAVTPEVGAFDSWHSNLEIVGNGDIEFTGAIELGLNLGNNSDLFTVDFSSLEGNANGLTLGNFEMVEAVYGNGSIGYDAEVFVEISGNSQDGGSGDVGFDDDDSSADENDDRALISQGVPQYTVTVIEGDGVMNLLQGDTATIRLCDQTEDLEVIALRGNWNDTLEILDAAHGLNFELQTGGTLKREGPTHTANVGKIEGNFKWDHAETTVDIIRSVAGDDRPIDAAGIVMNNVDSLTVNSVGPAVTIGMVMGDSLNSVDLNAEGDMTVESSFDVDGDVSLIDAAGVVGTFTGTVDGDDDGDFTFVGAEGGSTLTLLNVDDDASGGVSIGGAGVVDLIIDGDVDLDESTLTNIGTVTLLDGSSLQLTMDQADTIGAGNFIVADGDSADLMLTGLSDQVFALANYDDDLNVSITLADDPVVTLNAATDLTGITSLVVPEGTTLVLTAAQFQQLNGDGTITGLGNVHITDMTQADVGAAGEDLDLDDLDVTGTVTVTLAEDVDLSDADLLDTGPVVDTFNIGDGQTLILGDVTIGDGVSFVGGTDSTLQFTDTTGFLVNIDASGFDVDTLRITDLLVSGNNVDYIFAGLSARVTKVIYNGDGTVEGRLQNVVIEEGTTVFGDISFNEYQLDSEVTVLTMNLEGGTEISGDLVVSTVEVNIVDDGLVPSYLQELIINSTGTAGNNVSGETANVIDGDITPAAYIFAIAAGSRDNNLKNVVINAEQALDVTGTVIFNSHGDDDNLGNKPDDGVTANDDDAAIVTLDVNGAADVNIGEIDTSDDDVDAVVINNNGTGALTVGIDGANVDAGDAITFNGSATATDTISIEGTLDLSDDTLNDVDVLLMDNDAGVVTLTVSQAQFNDIGVAGFQTTEDNDFDDGNAILNLVEFGSDPFDATALDADIDLNDITMASGDITLDPATDLTGVSRILVPEGGSLTLTAAQFLQLDGTGVIESLDGPDAGTAAGPITVNITGLTQADVDSGVFSLAAVNAGGGEVILSLAESVDLGTDDVLTTAGTEEVEVLLADGQDLGLATFEQADGLDVTGTGDTDVFFRFDTGPAAAPVSLVTTLDASGFDVTRLHALNTFLGGFDVEYILDDLDEAVVLHIYNDPEDLGFLNQTNRVVVVEPGVTVSDGAGFGVALAFNDLDPDDEVVTLTMTLSGGVILDGDIRLDTTTPAPGLLASNFQTLTLISTGDGVTENLISGGTNNIIDGDISPFSPGPFLPNNLLNVIVNADQEMEITGTVIFNGLTGDDDAATLTVMGTAPVTIKALDTTDTDIDSLTIDNQGTGTLTITGGSDALEMDGTESLTLTGTGDIVLDTDDGAGNNGIEGNALTSVDASGLAGNLTVGVVEDVDNAEFSFVSGTGVTTMTFSSADALDSTGVDTTPGTLDDTAGWSIDYTNAAAGSKLTIEGMAQPVLGSNLSIEMGANGVLCINQDLNLSDLNLTLNSAQPIVLADGASLTLTAAQADGLVIVGENGAASTGVVNIVDLGDDPVDLSGISADVAGGVYLEDDDVTLDAATDLGSMTVKLVVNDDSDLNPAGGQTIRLATEAQADGTAIDTIKSFVDDGVSPVTDVDWVLADDTSGNDYFNSSNVAWLFDAVSGPLDTSNYDDFLGRLWYSNDLLNSVGGAVEQLFNTLPFTIQRVDFNTVTELDILLASAAVDRVVELTSFTDVVGLVEVDDGPDPEEHIATLTVDFGGEVTAGDFVIGDVVAAPDTDPLTPDFTTLTLNSRVALSDSHYLATEDHLNDNDGTDEAGETVQPTATNTIGDIEVGGTNPLIELMDVVINTYDDATPIIGSGTANATDDDAGADFVLQTLTFSSAGDDVDANLDVNGENDVTGKGIDASDADITSVTIDTAGHTGTLTWTGGSPAFAGGDDAGDGNTETLTFTNGGSATGDVWMGHEFVADADPITVGDQPGHIIHTDGVNPYAGIDASTLSTIDTSDHGATVNLGVVSDIDSEDFTLNNDGGAGNVTLCLGEAIGVGGVLETPELSATGSWDFSNEAGATGTLALEIKDVVLNNGGSLELDGVDVTITGDVDLSVLDVADLSISGGSIVVAAGGNLTLSIEQVTALDAVGYPISGEGTVTVVGESDDGVAATSTDFDNLHTATVDLSAVTLGGTDDGVLNITASGADDGTGTQITQTIIGSDNDDHVTLDANDGDATTIDVITQLGADGGTIGDVNDTPSGTPDATEVAGDRIFKSPNGATTVQVIADEGFDQIDFFSTGDVFQVAAGAEFYGADVDSPLGFVATADSTNEGTAVLEAADDGDDIDVSAAVGANGWSLLGASDPAANELIGSEQDDTIVDGPAVGVTNVGEEDTHTGNGGADTFVFNFATTTPATLADVENNPALDEEEITAVAGTNGGGESLVINYAVGNTLGSLTVNDINYTNAGFVGDVDFSNTVSLAGAIADMMGQIAGVTAVSDGVDTVTLTGDNGERMNISSLTPGGGAGASTTADAGTDTAQDNTVTITGGGNSGELYTMTAQLSDGTDIEASYLAVGAVGADDIATGLIADFNAASGGAMTAAPGGTFGAGAAEIDLQDNTADDGGFEVTVLTATTSVGAASSSSLLDGTEADLTDADADVVTDFMTAEGDLISFGLAAGDNSNYDEDAYYDTFVLAQAAADAAFAGDAALVYFLTGTNDVGAADGGATGLLFLNVDGDTDADAVLSMVGVDESNFDEDQIV
ncbi:DUF4214 domain-containing protein [Sulfitobacter mediterraneus]|uniref:DUF4214 domain-containing protein n=1 Tax=Sulfitobacter mediterraneus TaxID=83219 RepID=UPI0013C433BB|nr:DUF4214 domain-containing protein [Sulfitobacter mediterraneus]